MSQEATQSGTSSVERDGAIAVLTEALAELDHLSRRYHGWNSFRYRADEALKYLSATHYSRLANPHGSESGESPRSCSEDQK